MMYLKTEPTKNVHLQSLLNIYLNLTIPTDNDSEVFRRRAN